jgi:hypothetical protein
LHESRRGLRILDHQDRPRKPSEAVLVRLVRIHRGFIAPRYRGGCPMASRLHNTCVTAVGFVPGRRARYKLGDLR